MKYKDLLAQSKEQKDAAQHPIMAAEAANKLEQGILTLKSQSLDLDSQIKRQEGVKESCAGKLEAIKGAWPFNVQALLDARGSVTQADENIAALKEAQNVILDNIAYLETLKTELF